MFYVMVDVICMSYLELQVTQRKRETQISIFEFESNTNVPLTNKAVVPILRALSKPPQRRQCPDPRPLLF